MTTACRPSTASARHFLGLVGLVATLGGCESRSDTATASRRPAPAGMAATAPPARPTPAAPLGRVEVTSAGFEPPQVDLGSDRAIVFRRTTDKTCATSVVFPALGIEKALPLNTDVAVALPPGASGELAFQCGMGMDRGKVIVR